MLIWCPIALARWHSGTDSIWAGLLFHMCLYGVQWHWHGGTVAQLIHARMTADNKLAAMPDKWQPQKNRKACATVPLCHALFMQEKADNSAACPNVPPHTRLCQHAMHVFMQHWQQTAVQPVLMCHPTRACATVSQRHAIFTHHWQQTAMTPCLICGHITSPETCAMQIVMHQRQQTAMTPCLICGNLGNPEARATVPLCHALFI